MILLWEGRPEGGPEERVDERNSDGDAGARSREARGGRKEPKTINDEKGGWPSQKELWKGEEEQTYSPRFWIQQPGVGGTPPRRGDLLKKKKKSTAHEILGGRGINLLRDCREECRRR